MRVINLKGVVEDQIVTSLDTHSVFCPHESLTWKQYTVLASVVSIPISRNGCVFDLLKVFCHQSQEMVSIKST